MEGFTRDKDGNLYHFGRRVPTWDELQEQADRLTPEDLDGIRPTPPDEVPPAPEPTRRDDAWTPTT